MGIYDNCSSTYLWERVSFRLCFENCYQKKNYILVYMKKKYFDNMPYNDFKKFLQGFCLGIDWKIN